MTINELRHLVAQGEGQYLEFKKKADHPDKIVREMVAFANSGGGTLLLGVSDNGQITGLKFPDEEAYAMEAALSMYAKPKIDWTLKRIPIGQGMEVLLYRIAPGNQKPYGWLTDKMSDKYRAYVRSKDQSIQASKEMFYLLRFNWESNTNRPLELRQTEQQLLRYLSDHPWITIQEMTELAQISKKKAAEKLVRLTRQQMLRIEPWPEADRYFLADGFKDNY